MRSDKDARPVRAAHSSPAPSRARAESGEALVSVWRLIGAALALLALLLIVWVAGHVHPEITTVSASSVSPALPGVGDPADAGTAQALGINRTHVTRHAFPRNCRGQRRHQALKHERGLA